MNTILAFDQLSRTLSGCRASSLAEEAMRHLFPTWMFFRQPLSSNGDELCEGLMRFYYGKAERSAVLGASLQPVEGSIHYVQTAHLPAELRAHLRVPPSGEIALIEGASACGLATVAEDGWSPERTSSYGVGQLIARAAEEGVHAILLVAGELATLDLGLGAVEAIGVELRSDERQRMSRSTPGQWGHLGSITGEVWPHIPQIYYVPTREHTLLGPNGSVAQRGRAIGLLPEAFSDFERRFGAAAKKLCQGFDKPRTLMAQRGAGDGGGLGFGLNVVCDAEIIPAARLLPRWYRWAESWPDADLILTGCTSLTARQLDEPQFRQLLSQADLYRKPLLIFTGRADPGLKLPPMTQVHVITPPGVTREAYEVNLDKYLVNTIARVFQKKASAKETEASLKA